MIVCRMIVFFCAFSSTSAWVVIAFVVGNEQEKKTFACILYDVQKNTVYICFENIRLFFCSLYYIRNCIYIKISVPYQEPKRDHIELPKERCVRIVECGNEF